MSINYRGSTSIISKKKKIAQLIIARLEARDINKKFKYYQSLVKKGIGGFVIFGGKLKDISRAIKKLQDSAEIPLFIASDLEQGLGQQIEGGTLFPPAMAVTQAVDLKNKKDVRLLRKSVSIIAQEAKAIGINVIFSPVLDVNTNPKNPIICTRAFSDNPQKVAWFGKEFIKGFQKQGLIACAKHFPGHGDTTKDSHRELPVVKADIKRLKNIDLYPFSQAVKAGVKMIMAGHLKVPVIDSKLPSSLSQKIIHGLLKNKMNFQGLVITDAINMRAIKLGEEKACLMALNAGADILLHPSKPEKITDYLSSRWNEIIPGVEKSFQKIVQTKKGLRKAAHSSPNIRLIGTKSNWETAKELTRKSIKIKNGLAELEAHEIKENISRAKEEPVVIIIDDDNNKSGNSLIKNVKKFHPKTKSIYIDNNYQGNIKTTLNHISNKILIVAVFSKISAWKGRSGISRRLKTILERAVKVSRCSIVAGFCCPYSLSDVKADAIINAYSDSRLTQEAVGKILYAP